VAHATCPPERTGLKLDGASIVLRAPTDRRAAPAVLGSELQAYGLSGHFAVFDRGAPIARQFRGAQVRPHLRRSVGTGRRDI
jgi:hypothetical protein